MQIPLVPERQIPSGDLPFPVPPQTWHFRRSVDYSLTANYAVLNYAARNRDELLFNIWQMGHNAIERGSRDHWTLSPKRAAAMRTAATPLRPRPTRAPDDSFRFANARAAPWCPRSSTTRPSSSPTKRDPRGYIIPRDQADFPDRGEVHQHADPSPASPSTAPRRTSPSRANRTPPAPTS
jgi:hypothetical protein